MYSLQTQHYQCVLNLKVLFFVLEDYHLYSLFMFCYLSSKYCIRVFCNKKVKLYVWLWICCLIFLKWVIDVELMYRLNCVIGFYFWVWEIVFYSIIISKNCKGFLILLHWNNKTTFSIDMFWVIFWKHRDLSVTLGTLSCTDTDMGMDMTRIWIWGYDNYWKIRVQHGVGMVIK